MDFPLLSVIVLLPAVGGLIVLALPRRRGELVLPVALALSLRNTVELYETGQGLEIDVEGDGFTIRRNTVVGAGAAQILPVGQQILGVQSQAITQRRWLGRLQVGESDQGQMRPELDLTCKQDQQAVEPRDHQVK